MLQIKVVNKGHQPLPQYATSQSAGMDLRANLDAPVVLKPMERRLIPTGLHIALPAGYEAQVRPRSGLALKKGITESVSPRWSLPDTNRDNLWLSRCSTRPNVAKEAMDIRE